MAILIHKSNTAQPPYRRAPDGYVTAHELARRARVSPSLVKRMMMAGQVPGAVRSVGRRIPSARTATRTLPCSGGLKSRVGAAPPRDDHTHVTCWVLPVEDAERWLAECAGDAPEPDNIWETALLYGLKRPRFSANDLAKRLKRPIRRVIRDIEAGELPARRGTGTRPRCIVSLADGVAYLTKHGFVPGAAPVPTSARN